jgi:excisionase family DNA binding protein
MSTLLTETEAAERLRVSLATLRRRRCEGRAPAYIKVGASVRYRVEDLDAFIESCLVAAGGTK